MYRLLFLILTGATTLSAQEFIASPVAVEIKSSFRGLSVVDDKVVWVSGTNGWVGKSTNGGKNFLFRQVKGFESLDFRSLFAFDSLRAVIANAGSPSVILVTRDGGIQWKEVFRNEDKRAFFDGIDFWNEQKGIIYGDPVDSRMAMYSTSDGGMSWSEIPIKSRPLMKEGEASFAASGTGIRCLDRRNLIIATGGLASRVWISKDAGLTWTTHEPPVVQGTDSKGIFSIAARGMKNLVVVGGDYKKDTVAVQQALYSSDGGLHWLPSANPTGYRECVEFITRDILIATGPGGTDISHDGGRNWSTLSTVKRFHAVRKARRGTLIVMAGNQQISVVERR